VLDDRFRFANRCGSAGSRFRRDWRGQAFGGLVVIVWRRIDEYGVSRLNESRHAS
jgi:hypothetical protein